MTSNTTSQEGTGTIFSENFSYQEWDIRAHERLASGAENRAPEQGQDPCVESRFWGSQLIAVRQGKSSNPV